MADGFGRVPIKAEVAAGDGEIRGDGQLLAGAKMEQGAVITDARRSVESGALAARARIRASSANSPGLPELGDFTRFDRIS